MHPWESISINFVGVLPTTRKGHDYLFVVVDRFNKKTINKQEATNLFFGQVWVHFGIKRNVISYKDARFLMHFALHCGRKWTRVDNGQELKRSTAFHP